jgi:hypothetical protein
MRLGDALLHVGHDLQLGDALLSADLLTHPVPGAEIVDARVEFLLARLDALTTRVEILEAREAARWSSRLRHWGQRAWVWVRHQSFRMFGRSR